MLNRFEILKSEQLDIAMEAIFHAIDVLADAPMQTETIRRLRPELEQAIEDIKNRREDVAQQLELRNK